MAKPNDDTPEGFAAQPYAVPSVFVLKNCELITQTGGYQTKELDQTIGPYFDRLLWPIPEDMQGEEGEEQGEEGAHGDGGDDYDDAGAETVELKDEM